MERAGNLRKNQEAFFLLCFVVVGLGIVLLFCIAGMDGGGLEGMGDGLGIMHAGMEPLGGQQHQQMMMLGQSGLGSQTQHPDGFDDDALLREDFDDMAFLNKGIDEIEQDVNLTESERQQKREERLERNREIARNCRKLCTPERSLFHLGRIVNRS